MNSVVAFSTFTVLYNHHLYLVMEDFRPPNGSAVPAEPWASHMHGHKAPGNHHILSLWICLFHMNRIFHISYKYPISMDISCKWNHTLCDLLCLASSGRIMFSGTIHCSAGQCFLFVTRNIPLCGCAILCLSIYLLTHTELLPPLGHCEWGYVCEYQFSFLGGICLGADLLDQMANLCLTFLRTSTLFSFHTYFH